MKKAQFEFAYRIYDSIQDLPDEEKTLLTAARNATEKSYAPYSNFYVGAAAKLLNGEIVSGANQENAAFPVSFCAERVVLSAVASHHTNERITAMAVSYKSEVQQSDHPISPCGMCRQALQEFESRGGSPIKLILGGAEGTVYVIESASQLLPLAFTSSELE